MAWSYEALAQSEIESLTAEDAAARAELERCRLAEDPHGARAALDRIYAVDYQVTSLNQRIQNMQRSQAQQAPNPYGLSKDERDIAAQHPDPGMSVDAKERLYAYNKQRYQNLRGSGYRDELDLQGKR
jgi:hypothetical protein